MATTTTVSPDAPDSPVPDIDDIADPPVPEEVQTAIEAPVAVQTAKEAAWREHEALLHGALAYLMNRINTELSHELRTFGQTFDSIVQQLRTTVPALIPQPPAPQAAPRPDPYEASVECCAPNGFAVQITVRKQTTEELVEALPGLLNWLQQSGYTALPAS